MEWATAELHGVSGNVYPVVYLVGDLDLESSEAARSAVRPMLDGSAPVVVVNLDGVLFIDSTGLSVLIACHNAAATAGAECRFVSHVPKVLRLMEATKINTFLRIFPTNESAVGVI